MSYQQYFFQRNFFICYAILILTTILFTNPIIGASNQKKKIGDKRISFDSELRVQYYDRTAALTEWNDENTLIGCELVSISNQSTFNELTGFIIDEPKPVTFDEMMVLIDYCDTLHTPLKKKPVTIFSKQTLNVISGIFPGTKWCGTKNLADSFHDLGIRVELDRCCRKHDFCPVKLRGMETRYNITNTSKFTKLHCKCDEAFYSCLKTVNNPSANLVGRTYFNLGKRNCFEDESGKYDFKKPKSY